MSGRVGRRAGGQPGRRAGGQFGSLGAIIALAKRAGLLLILLPLCPPARLPAQTEPRLAQGMRLAQEGLGDSARSVVQRVVDATNPADTLYPQALFTRAVVGANPQDMRRDLQRVAVEYSSSSWADDALLRLAQLDFATGELERATRDLERLRLDYSTSPLYAQAAFWAARIYFDLRKPPSACRWIAEGLPRAGNDLELRNQLTFYSQRCTGVALDTATVDTAGRRAGGQAGGGDSTGVATTAAGAHETTSRAVADSLPAGPPAPLPTRPPAPLPDSLSARPPVRPSASGPSAFRIQIAAVNTRGAADSIAKRVNAAGFAAVVAAEKGLFKVRVGPYASRAQAQAALPSVRAKLGGKPFVVADS
jgi:cell division septation protein DedD